MRRAAAYAAVSGALLGLAACESTPERVFTYGAHGAEIQAERLVADVYGLPAHPLPYGGPDIERSLASIKARWPQLRPLLEDGTLGFTEDGDIALRDPGTRDRDALRSLRALLKAENRDRFVLYRGVTAGIGHGTDTMERMVLYTEDVFAREWFRQAPKGWWLQDHRGQWRQKD